MEEKHKKIISFSIAIIMIVTLLATLLAMFTVSSNSISASAESVNTDCKSAENEAIMLYIENEKIVTTKETITFSAELMIDSEINRASVIGGLFDTTIYIGNDNRHGEIWWSIVLTTGDVIKSVTGSVIVKRDWFGPINPILYTTSVNHINYGTQFSTANDIVEYDLGSTYKDSDNFIFQFRNFQVFGVQEHYTVGYREVQKEIRELERF